MADKINDAPPSYYAAQGGAQGPSAPKPAYNQQYPSQDQQYGGYPPQGANYYQQQPNMGYYGQQQPGPYQQGPYQQGPYQQGPYGRPGGYYQQDNRGHGAGTGLMEGLMAGLCCCCCLDLLF
ncbi:hypothetical protein N0V93_007424 [Gnomoniopsis smithogilvyi]|uniref:Cysteine-rich transmembrane domain-containing protein n=1 Tax=Gnomoniopsis smithogilvyi TaxID=1191159 RepID=A0A9W8YSP2_9PEZI|nr:hypothetical protein N0V93_007424 [Gnomoniopsis smithogilvyi]